MRTLESRLAAAQRQLRFNRLVFAGLLAVLAFFGTTVLAQPFISLTKVEFLDMPENAQVLYVAGALDGMSFMAFGYSPADSEKLHRCMKARTLGQITKDVSKRVRIAVSLGDIDTSVATDMAKYFGATCPH